MTSVAVVFQSFVRAGSQRHIVEILKGIRQFRPDFQCTLFLIAPPSSVWSTFLPDVEQEGIPVVHAPYVYERQDSSSLPARLFNWWSRHRREGRLNEQFYRHLHQFDTIVCTEFFVADLLLPYLRSDQRLCFHLMEHLAQRTSAGHYRLLRHPRLNLIFMHSSQIDQLPLPVNLERTITWPVRLCPDHLQQALPPIHASDTLRIAHYSRISPMRLIDQMIDAFALLHLQTTASLRIAGFIEDPSYHKNLLEQIQRLGLTDVIQFVDPVPSPADDPERYSVDLVWMISLSGHVGYAAIEAMAAGLPTLLLEVDSHDSPSPLEPILTPLICMDAQQLVERSLALQADPAIFCKQQHELLVERFITTAQAINDLAAFYQGRV